MAAAAAFGLGRAPNAAICSSTPWRSSPASSKLGLFCTGGSSHLSMNARCPPAALEWLLVGVSVGVPLGLPTELLFGALMLLPQPRLAASVGVCDRVDLVLAAIADMIMDRAAAEGRAASLAHPAQGESERAG